MGGATRDHQLLTDQTETRNRYVHFKVCVRARELELMRSRENANRYQRSLDRHARQVIDLQLLSYADLDAHVSARDHDRRPPNWNFGLTDHEGHSYYSVNEAMYAENKKGRAASERRKFPPGR